MSTYLYGAFDCNWIKWRRWWCPISRSKVNYISVKKNIQSHVLEVVQAIYYLLFSKAAVNVNSDHGHRIVFDICYILNCNLWLKPTSNEEAYIVWLNAFKNVFDHCSGIEVFTVFTVDDVTEGFLTITSYTYRYFDIPNIKPVEFWSKMLDLHKDNMSMKAVLLVVELCFGAPIPNATLKRLSAIRIW